MAKTKSERMKEYRARKMATMGDDWLKRERDRVKNYYVPVTQLQRGEKAARRERVRKNVKAHRQRQKLNTTVEVEDEATTPSTELVTTDENGVSSTSEPGPSALIVKLPSVNKYRSAGKKRTARALSKAYRQVELLKRKTVDLQRKLNTSRKRLERHTKKLKQPATPRGKTDRLLRQAKLNPRRATLLRKKLLYAECMSEEVKQSKGRNHQKNNVISKVVSGRIMKKYRLMSMLQRSTGLSRRLRCTDKAWKLQKQQRSMKIREAVAKKIVDFLERDDNSRMMPGKADAVKVGTEKKQKRVLNDYLHNLYMKFAAENDHACSLATFCRYRPNHICLVNFTSRNSCLCSRHQNFALKLRSLKLLGVITCTSPDKFVDLYRADGVTDVLSNIPAANVRFQEWKRVKMPDGKQKMRVVDVDMSKEEFTSTMQVSFAEFIEHVERVKLQYRAVKTLKENLPINHVLVQMDFSENYSCQSMEEIQSAYWNSSMVTLHPTIVYYKEDGSLKHLSTVFVSEVLQHNASMVLAILVKLMSTISEAIPAVTHVHYWTDSPTSQYRNKVIFDIVSRHEELFNVRASWQYFEAGHGKGPCDGIGGTTKRNADNAVKQGKATIQDARDFFAWTVTESGSQIKYQFISKDEYDDSSAAVADRIKQLKPLKGTMKVHAISAHHDGQVIARDTSCICDNCFNTDGFNHESPCTWTVHTLTKPQTIAQVPQIPTSVGQEITDMPPVTAALHLSATDGEPQPSTDEMEITDRTSSLTEEVSDIASAVPCNIPTPGKLSKDVGVGDFVVALYDQEGFIGKILEVDEDSDEVLISFMERSGKVEGHYRWPPRADEIWVTISDVKKTIPEPQPTGKSKRVFAVSPEILRAVKCAGVSGQ